MRISLFHTFWISIISLLAMLTSGFVSSASIMPMNMNMMNQQQSLPSSIHKTAEQELNSHINHMAMMSNSMPDDCDSDSDMIHNCCTVTCTNTYAFFPTIHQSTQHHTQLALFSAEQPHTLTHRAQSLYRPPIT